MTGCDRVGNLAISLKPDDFAGVEPFSDDDDDGPKRPTRRENCEFREPCSEVRSPVFGEIRMHQLKNHKEAKMLTRL